MGFRKGIKWSLEALGTARFHRGDPAAARAAYEESLAVNRQMKDRYDEGIELLNAGLAARHQGDLPAARAYFTEARQLCEELKNQTMLIAALHHLGETARLARAHEEAEQLLEQSLALAREGGNRAGALCSLHKLAQLAVDQQDWARARIHWLDLIALAREWTPQEGRTWGGLSEQLGMPITRGRLLDPRIRAWGRQKPLLDVVEALSRMWQQRGEPVRATRLLGTAQAAQAALRPMLSDHQPPDYAPPEDLLSRLRAALDPEAFEAAWAEGRAMSLRTAIECALDGMVADE
jgi:tetratricopeptide (TPR) repeat protein